jgi:uncharacterized protein
MAAATAFRVRSPRWQLTYQGVDITTETAPMVTRIAYTDYVSGLSGDLEIAFEDRDGRWQNSWYPTPGNQLSLAIGYLGETLLPCGEFQVDEVELTGPPDAFRIRCLAAFITPPMRTRNSLGYENQTLLGIAQFIADKYGFVLSSAGELVDVAFARVTQKNETDLAFLKRLAIEHGYDFTLRGPILVFYSRTVLEAVPPLLTISRSELERFEFRNRTHGTYLTSQVSYQRGLDKALISLSTAAAAPIPTTDVAKFVARCENAQQALVKAQAALLNNNTDFVEASLTMPGSVAIASGITVNMSGFGVFDGVYIIRTVCHQIDRAHGYVTGVEASRVY